MVVHRQDGLLPDQLRDLAQAVRGPRGPGGGGGGVARRRQGGAWRWPRATRVSTPGCTAKELAAAGRAAGAGARPSWPWRAGRTRPQIDPLLAEARRRARCLTRVRVVGIDLGQRRIGVAVSDGTGTLASPRGTIERTGDAAADWQAVVAAVTEEGAGHVVVGLPLSLDGRRGPAARAAEADAERLARALGPPRGERSRPSTSASRR